MGTNITKHHPPGFIDFDDSGKAVKFRYGKQTIRGCIHTGDTVGSLVEQIKNGRGKFKALKIGGKAI